MANSATNLDLLSTSQAQKEVTANALFDAVSTGTTFGRRASACVGLTWAYYGGTITNSSNVLTQIANGTVTLSNNTTNYVEADADGTVTKNTSAFTAGRTPLYTVVTSSGQVTSYTDWRKGLQPGTSGGGVRTINAQTGTTYTLVLADGSYAGGNPLLTLTNAAAITLTVPPNSSVAFPIGSQVDLAQGGAGKVTLAPGSGVTLQAQGGNLSVAAQYGALSLVKTATNTWLVIGATIA